MIPLNRGRFLIVLILSGLVFGLLAACSGGQNIVEPEAEEVLVVYSGRSESLVGPIIEQFEIATGINVDVKYGGTAEIAATLQEEGENTPADVFFAQDPGGLGVVVDMLGPLPDDITGLVPDWARSPDGRWVGISGRARVVVFNTDNLAEGDLPASISGFTDPKWKGRIGWPSSNASFQTMITAMRNTWGEEKTREWLEGIKANEPKDYPNNTSIVASVETGEIDVGLVNHYYLYRFIQEDGEEFAARNHHLTEGGPGSLVMVAGAGILNTSENKENAERFLKFMLSKVAQQYFAGQTYEYPLVSEVTTHRLLVPLDKINKPQVDMASLRDVQGTQSLMRDVGVLP